jgi:hypothetical protein
MKQELYWKSVTKSTQEIAKALNDLFERNKKLAAALRRIRDDYSGPACPTGHVYDDCSCRESAFRAIARQALDNQ